MDEKFTLKDAFDLAVAVWKDKRSNKITAGVAALGLVGAMAAGVDPTITKAVAAGAGLGVVKAVTGYCSVGWEALKNIYIPS